MANVLAYGTQIIGGGASSSSGGHTIVNASGTELAQEDKLKFAGSLKTTDDSTNGMTVVDDSPTEIAWSVWQTMTPAQRDAIPKALITDVPGCDISIRADLMTILWTNPDPSSSFAAQQITLNSDDYDCLLIVYRMINTYAGEFSQIIEKGTSTYLTNMLDQPTSPYAQLRNRSVARVSDTVYNIDDAYLTIPSSGTTKNNTIQIPITIYGIKKTIEFDFSSIASDVSTSANKCMLSDGVTSVEDRIASTWNGITFSSSINNGHSSIMRTNNMVTVTGYWAGSITGTTSSIGTVPSGFRPSATYIGVGTITGASGNVTHALYWINSSGEITQQVSSGTTTAGTFIFTYPI